MKAKYFRNLFFVMSAFSSVCSILAPRLDVAVALLVAAVLALILGVIYAIAYDISRASQKEPHDVHAHDEFYSPVEKGCMTPKEEIFYRRVVIMAKCAGYSVISFTRAGHLAHVTSQGGSITKSIILNLEDPDASIGEYQRHLF